ncbi:Endonuclease/exonuclease/phosphatase [Dichomitus squalens]|uniref:Endonuclease/exonuclease/phosphatase n=1 Tax=Dichomitus squalens TaxID=114155 RepID=A0A4Q9NZ56_9APHY|nr:Endonuclease/exonuclease/phosphatase [Dichomitus squalens]TBU47200.1 Endonuclease/exonuclease/phosphatase [Dichomitus squalens]TBU57881.1 Endonuclease/exonuclease/phosphatase [Dichomitus squalens]
MLSFEPLLGLLSLLLTLGVQGVATMRVSTYNLRYDSMPNNITVAQTLSALPDPLTPPTYYGAKGEQPWSTRRVKVYEHLNNAGVVLAGFQEALVRQVDDLATLFGDEWSWVGVGRDDGVAAGEFSPIFYKKSDIELISNDSFWLSNTPFEPSKYPNAGSFRICTATHLLLKTGPSGPVRFTYLNTHLDDQSDDERRLAASLMLVRARYEAYTTNGPVIITGDFNSPSTGTDSGAYQIITGQIPPEPVNATFAAKYAVPNGTLSDFTMLDLKAEVPREYVSGEYATYTGFGAPGDATDFTRIDFVYGGSNGKWTATGYHVGTSLTDDGVLASDHRPVFADITLH